MKTKWLAALMLLASCCAGVPAFAQQPIKPRFVVLDDYVRDLLEKDWDAHSKDPMKLERGYCLGWQYDLWAGEPAYRVTQIRRADSTDADPSSIRFHCTGKNVAELHVHPATTCYMDALDIERCWEGGPYAWQCLPSDSDRNYVVYEKQEFGMVQCTREGTVFYFATGDDR